MLSAFLNGNIHGRIIRQAFREGGELLILSPETVLVASLSALPDSNLSDSKDSGNYKQITNDK